MVKLFLFFCWALLVCTRLPDRKNFTTKEFSDASPRAIPGVIPRTAVTVSCLLSADAAMYLRRLIQVPFFAPLFLHHPLRRSHGGGREPRGGTFKEDAKPTDKTRRNPDDCRGDMSSAEDDPSKQTPVRSLSQEAAALWGFLEGDEKPADRRSWYKRQGNSSGGEFDQIGAHALAYRQARERQKQQQKQEIKADGRVGELAGGMGEIEVVRMLPTRRQQQQQQQSKRQGVADEEEEQEAFSTPVGRRRSRLTSNDRQGSPTPEELAAIEADAFYARQKERLPAASTTPGSPTQPAVCSPIPHLHIPLSTPRMPSRDDPSSPPLCTSPFFAAARSSLLPKLRADGGGPGLSDNNAEPSIARREVCAVACDDADATPPMWKSRRPMVGGGRSPEISPPFPPPARTNNKETATHAGGVAGVCEGQGRSAAYNTPPASPPPPFARTSKTATPAAIIAVREAIRLATTQAGDSSLQVAKGGRAIDNHPEWECDTIVGKADDGKAAVKRDGCDNLGRSEVGSEVGTSATVPAVAAAAGAAAVPHPARGVRLAVEPPPDLFGSHSPMQLRPTTQPPQPHVQLVKKSNNRPMSLPPADDSGDTPEPDHFGGSTPAAAARRNTRAVVVGAARGGNCNGDGAGVEADAATCSPATRSDVLSQPSSQGATPGDLHEPPRQATPKAGTRAGQALPERLNSLTSLWGDFNLSKDMESGDEDSLDSDFSVDEVRPAKSLATVFARRQIQDNTAISEASTAAPAPQLQVSQPATHYPVPALGGTGASSGDIDSVATGVAGVQKPTKTTNLENGGARTTRALERWRGISRGSTAAPATNAATTTPSSPLNTPAPAQPGIGNAEGWEVESVSPPNAAVNEGGQSATAAGAVESGGAPVVGASQGNAAAEAGKGGSPASSAVAPSAAPALPGAATSGRGGGGAPPPDSRLNGVVGALNSTGIHQSNGVVGNGPSTVAPSSAPRAPCSTVVVSAAQASKPRGRVAAMAASFTAGKGGGRTDVAIAVVGGCQGGGDAESVRPPSKILENGGSGGGGGGGGGGRREDDRGRVGGTARRKGPIEGLPFGNVRQKASAWGKAWRS